jgi:virginiamycin B lyase
VRNRDGSIVLLTSPSGDGPGLMNYLAPGPDGNVWTAEVSHIAKITPRGKIVEYPYPTGYNNLDYNGGVAAGPDGNVWFTLGGSSVGGVAKIDPRTGLITVYPSVCEGSGIASADGVLFVPCGPFSAWLEEVDVDGTSTLLPNPFQSTQIPIVGPDHHVWFVSGFNVMYYNQFPVFEEFAPSTGALTSYPPPTTLSSYPRAFAAIATGSDGNVWGLDWSGYVDVYHVLR